MINLQDLYYNMRRIRLIEQAIAEKYKEQKMRCPVHLSIGQEAPAVGVCAALLPEDKMVSTHRGHAHYLAKGGSLVGLIGELYGKACGSSRGNGGSMHLIDLNVNFWGSTSIVAQTIPIGVGLAFSDKLQGKDTYTAVCFGDAAIEEGVFHESANFASLHNLNVIFVCENNLYSCFTRLNDRQPDRPFEKVAAAHSLRFLKCQPNVLDILSKAREARNSLGPTFLEIPAYRELEHCGPNNDDHLNYRPDHEIESWRNINFIPENHDETSLIKKDIEDAFKLVELSPPPATEEYGKYVFAPSHI
jgi:pyruvate dehydrogenase E1 component alpha subunit